MNTFQRYLLSFSLVVSALIILLGILVFADSEINATPLAVFLVIIAGLIYVIPMTCLFSYNAELVQLEILDTVDEQRFAKLEDIIYKKCKREIKKTVGSTSIYSMKNRHHAWLTNSVEIINENDKYIVKIPRAFAKEVQKIFSCKTL